MRISDFLAQTITQRRALVWSSVALLTVACIAILVTSLQLDSEIFNVLPGKFSSVQGLKIYDRDFEQTRELTFALQCDPKDVDKLDEFAPVFAERLRQQHWCTRVLLVVTNQQSISAFECQRLMREVNKFRAIAAEGWNPKSHSGLQVLVTGRSAFASEISLSMRYDVVATLLGSVILVGTIFFVGFRRWLPLLGMALCLLLSCLVALTLGQLLFGRLSMISVGFCAILVGLGVDFSILTIGRYHQARSDGEPHRQAIATSIAKLGRAIFFGALTTAVGFLALVLSGAMSFSQLGVLIAIGIFVAGLFMCSILFLFVRERQAIPHDWLFEGVRKYVRWIVRKPVPMLLFSTVLLLVLTAIGFSPNPPLHFETNTRSLQPRNIRASQALEAIMHEMPVRWEPVLAIVRSANPQDRKRTRMNS